MSDKVKIKFEVERTLAQEIHDWRLSLKPKISFSKACRFLLRAGLSQYKAVSKIEELEN